MADRENRISIVLTVVALALLALVVGTYTGIQQHRATVSTYQQVLELVEQQKYHAALELLEEIEDSGYQDTSALQAYCQANLASSEKSAYILTRDLQFFYLEPELEEQITTKISQIAQDYEADQKQEEERRAQKKTTTATTETSSAETPYVGEQNTTASASTSTGKKSSHTTTTADSDPYNAADYRNAEDFYDDHYYDFFDYYDAENYYREHHGD